MMSVTSSISTSSSSPSPSAVYVEIASSASSILLWIEGGGEETWLGRVKSIVVVVVGVRVWMGNFKLLLEEDTGVKEEGLRVGTFFHDLLVLIVTIEESVCVCCSRRVCHAIGVHSNLTRRTSMIANFCEPNKIYPSNKVKHTHRIVVVVYIKPSNRNMQTIESVTSLMRSSTRCRCRCWPRTVVVLILLQIGYSWSISCGTTAIQVIQTRHHLWAGKKAKKKESNGQNVLRNPWKKKRNKKKPRYIILIFTMTCLSR